MAVYENLQALIDLLGDAPNVAELTLSRPSGEQVTIKRPARMAAPASPMQAVGQPISSTTPAVQASAVEPHLAEPALHSAETSNTPSAATIEVLANRVGIYHPAKPPVELGSQVAVGQIVGYIEAIKLMNEVRAASAGIVAEQFVEEGMPVEYGQPLFQLASH